MATDITSKESLSTRPRRRARARIVQNFLLVWLDGSIDKTDNEDPCDPTGRLRQIVNKVKIFSDVDECITFIDEVDREKVLVIIPGFLGQIAVPVIHDKTQVDTIYIFCGNKTRHEKWAQAWSKVKGVFTDITPLCEAVKQAVQDCDQNSVSISLVKKTDGVANQNLNELDQSFMYTQIFKEILLTIDFKQEHIDEFLAYCREQFVGNIIELTNIDKFEKEYRQHQPIWWYTYDCFLYPMLNRSLRTMEVDLIIQMGFFIRDLHSHIAVLHSEQYAGQNYSNSFIVYRGQGLSQANFEEVMKTKGGLLAFNNFLSTSKIRDVSLAFARQTMTTSNLVGVLFVMTIDPSISSAPFANVHDVSAYESEEEILFSMHAVFRIDQIQQIAEGHSLWQVDLTLTGHNDSQLQALTERMREETKGSTGWLRLGKLMVKLAHYDAAEDLHQLLLEQTADEKEKGDILYELGCIHVHQEKFEDSLAFFENSLQIRKKILTSQHPDVADCYNNIGLTYTHMDKYSQALSSLEQAQKIYEETLPKSDSRLAIPHSTMGDVYNSMGEYSKALPYFEKALEICQKTLPANHPDLATTYNNVAYIHDRTGEYSKALTNYERALAILQHSLPPDHPYIKSVKRNIELMQWRL